MTHEEMVAWLRKRADQRRATGKRFDGRIHHVNDYEQRQAGKYEAIADELERLRRENEALRRRVEDNYDRGVVEERMRWEEVYRENPADSD